MADQRPTRLICHCQLGYVTHRCVLMQSAVADSLSRAQSSLNIQQEQIQHTDSGVHGSISNMSIASCCTMYRVTKIHSI